MLVFLYLLSFFFFSSRRRHTRWPRDWSSDVCSSDLDREEIFGPVLAIVPFDTEEEAVALANGTERSEERRVGKESRSRWLTYYKKKKYRTIRWSNIGKNSTITDRKCKLAS